MEEYQLSNLSLGNEEANRYSKKRFNTKFIHWSYEAEVRVILDNMANKSHKIPKNIFKEIIFGYKMSEQQQKEIKIICDSLYSNIKYFKSIPNKNKFEMKINSII